MVGWFHKIGGLTHPASFSQAQFADKKKITRREKFLGRMEEVIPCAPGLARQTAARRGLTLPSLSRDYPHPSLIHPDSTRCLWV